jgi:hypothetical protein
LHVDSLLRKELTGTAFHSKTKKRQIAAISSSTCLFWVVSPRKNVVVTYHYQSNPVHFCVRLSMHGNRPAGGNQSANIINQIKKLS